MARMRWPGVPEENDDGKMHWPAKGEKSKVNVEAIVRGLESPDNFYINPIGATLYQKQQSLRKAVDSLAYETNPGSD